MTASAPTTAEQTHPCVRCGDPIPLDDGMCERCNPLGLRQPASSQAHGTVAVGIIVAVVVLAILGRVALAGIGPFDGSVSRVVAQSPNLMVTLTVTNHGTKDGSVTCRVYDPSDPGIGPEAAYLLSPDVPAGGTISFAELVTTLGGKVKPLAADCSS